MNKNTLLDFAIAMGSGFAGWFWATRRTRREQQRLNIELINQAITPLIHSIRELTTYNQELIKKIVTINKHQSTDTTDQHTESL